MEKEKINRINELAHKAKTTGLSDEEKAEREALRREYIEAFRAGARATLESVLIQEEDGTLTPLKKRDPQDIKEDHGHHHVHGPDCCCGHHHDHHHDLPEQ